MDLQFLGFRWDLSKRNVKKIKAESNLNKLRERLKTTDAMPPLSLNIPFEPRYIYICIYALTPSRA